MILTKHILISSFVGLAACTMAGVGIFGATLGMCGAAYVLNYFVGS